MALVAKREPTKIAILWSMNTTSIDTKTSLRSSNPSEFIERIRDLCPLIAANSARHDEEGSFVADNYELLKEEGFFAATVPQELGGFGLKHSQMADLLRTIGQNCGSTALASSMHQHLVAANVWKFLRGQGGNELLRKVAKEQPILVSTGARDWLESNGEVEKVEGGYRVSASKHFASQSEGGDILVTSAPFESASEGWRVLHFGVSLRSEGVTVLSNWKTLGMRGTGSQTVQLERVFVPESAIALDRPRDGYHPVYNVVLGVALPYIMAAYLGIAQKAAFIAIETARKQKAPKSHVALALGKLNNTITTAELNWRDMVRIADDFKFAPEDRISHEMLTRKTNVAMACISTVEQAMGIVGGQGFYRGFGLERLFRDVQGARYHPLPELNQMQFCGEFLLRR